MIRTYVIDKVMNDLVVILIGMRIGEVELQFHVVGTKFEKTEAFLLIFHLTGLFDQLLDYQTILTVSDIWHSWMQRIRLVFKLRFLNDLEWIVDVKLEVRQQGNMIPIHSQSVLCWLVLVLHSSHEVHYASCKACALIPVGNSGTVLDHHLNIAAIFRHRDLWENCVVLLHSLFLFKRVGRQFSYEVLEVERSEVSHIDKVLTIVGLNGESHHVGCHRTHVLDEVGIRMLDDVGTFLTSVTKEIDRMRIEFLAQEIFGDDLRAHRLDLLQCLIVQCCIDLHATGIDHRAVVAVVGHVDAEHHMTAHRLECAHRNQRHFESEGKSFSL